MKKLCTKKKHVQNFLHMIFFHDDDWKGFPPNIRKLQLPSKLRIKPSMCEREEWPNHLQGNGVGDSPRDTKPWWWLTLPKTNRSTNYCSLQLWDILCRKSKKIWRPRGFSYISHIQKNVFKKRFMLFIKMFLFISQRIAPRARGLIEVNSSIFHFQRLGANRVAGEEQPSTVEGRFRRLDKRETTTTFGEAKDTPKQIGNPCHTPCFWGKNGICSSPINKQIAIW